MILRATDSPNSARRLGKRYASFGPRRSKNDIADAYFERLTSAGHGCTRTCQLQLALRYKPQRHP